MRSLSLFLAGVLSLSILGRARADESRRLFDFTPVSPGNPVVATIDEAIQIPLSELCVYRETEKLQAITDPASLAQKRALLDDLINEYLYVDEAYRTGVVQSSRFLKQMEATRTMILTDLMSTRAMTEAKPAVANEAAATLAGRLFNEATIDISNEAYAILQRAAQAVDKTSAASKRGPVVDSPEDAAAKLYAIINSTPEAVLVRYADKSLSIHEILSIYAGLPAPRPPVATHEGFITMIKPLIAPELMAVEAVRRGIASEPEFQHKLIQNQNALLRFHMQGLIDREANKRMSAPTVETELQAWYDQHKVEYAVTNQQGRKQIPSYAEMRSRVEGDYSVALRDRLLAEKAQALRKPRSVRIDEAVLRQL